MCWTLPGNRRTVFYSKNCPNIHNSSIKTKNAVCNCQFQSSTVTRTLHISKNSIYLSSRLFWRHLFLAVFVFEFILSMVMWWKLSNIFCLAIRERRDFLVTFYFQFGSGTENFSRKSNDTVFATQMESQARRLLGSIIRDNYVLCLEALCFLDTIVNVMLCLSTESRNRLH